MLKIIENQEHERWDEIVKTFSKHDIYYYSQQAKLYEIHGEGTPLLFYYADETCRAIHVVLRRDIAKNKHFQNKIDTHKYYDLTTPYGYGGFLIEGKFTEQAKVKLKQAYLNYCQQNQIVSEFVKFHPLLVDPNDLKSIFTVGDIGGTVVLDLRDKERIWENFSSSNRRNIRKAIKTEIEIYWSTDPSLLDDFIPMYEKTMDEANANDFYYFSREYYEYLIENLRENVLFFYAKLDGEIIAMAIIYLSNRYLHYHLSASKSEYRRYYPTNYLLKEVAEWGSEHGFTDFHLGGGIGGEEDRLLRFKQGFNKDYVGNLYVGQRIYKKEAYKKLVDLRGLKESSSTFFPLYRADNAKE